MSLVVEAFALFAFAFLHAGMEIEIEGRHGWAEKLPTWYRRTTFIARLYGRFMEGKPLTGYHLFMFALPLAAFHMGFALGQPWSLRAEVHVFALYPAWVVLWDFLWFVLNPAYGVENFRPGKIWWLDTRWVGPLPIDYARALGLSLAIAGAASLLAREIAPLRDCVAVLLGFGVLTIGAVRLSPRYHAWYRRMREPGTDERGVIDIYPPPDERPEDVEQGGS